MAISIYDVTVPVYRQFLRSLLGVLGKGEQHCADKGVDAAKMLASRLYEDMLPLSVQVNLAIGHSVGALAAVRGQQRPRTPALETFAACKQAVEQALSELDAITPEELQRHAEGTVELKIPGRELAFTTQGYLLSYAIPQFFFHVTTAYDILRKEGVQIGKRDFLGRIQLKSA